MITLVHSFYIGTELQDKDVFEGVIQYVSPMFKLGRSLGLSMNLLDLGGGFPGRLRPKTPFEEVRHFIHLLFNTFNTKYNNNKTAFI